MGKEEQREIYRKWWVGKMCRPANTEGPFKKVVDVNVVGPPSFVCGSASLVYEDGSKNLIITPAYRPRKRDVEVMEDKPES